MESGSWLHDSWVNMWKPKKRQFFDDSGVDETDLSLDELERREARGLNSTRISSSQTRQIDEVEIQSGKISKLKAKKSMNAHQRSTLAGPAKASVVELSPPLTQKTKPPLSFIRACATRLNPLPKLRRLRASSSSASLVNCQPVSLTTHETEPIQIQKNHTIETVDLSLDDVKDESLEILYEDTTHAKPSRPPRKLRRDLNNNEGSNGIKKQEKPPRSRKGKENITPTEKPQIIEDKHYAGKFSLDTYLNRSRDPLNSFMDDERECEFNATAIEFLINYFPKISKEIINKEYRSARYNMTIAALNLIRLEVSCFRKTTRNSYKIEAEDIYQLQEIQFIHNMVEAYRMNPQGKN